MSRKQLEAKVVPYHREAKQLLDHTWRMLERLGLIKNGLLTINKDHSDMRVGITSGIFCHSFRIQKQISKLCERGYTDCSYFLARGLFDGFVNLLLAIRSQEAAERYYDHGILETERYIKWAQKAGEKNSITKLRESGVLSAIEKNVPSIRKKHGLHPGKNADWYGTRWPEKYRDVGLGHFLEMPYALFSETIHAGPWMVLKRGRISAAKAELTYSLDKDIDIPQMVLATSGQLFILILAVFAEVTDNKGLMSVITSENLVTLRRHSDFQLCYEKNEILKKAIS